VIFGNADERFQKLTDSASFPQKYRGTSLSADVRGSTSRSNFHKQVLSRIKN
jgi:hypothetical protein